jgi:Holliday junction resolvase
MTPGRRINSMRKGCSGERELAKLLKQYGISARRGQQHAGGPNSPDVCAEDGGPCIPGWHLEVKRDKSIDIGTKAMSSAMNKAMVEAQGKKYAVLWRHNREQWRATWDLRQDGRAAEVTATIDDWLNLLGYSKGKP